MARIPLPDGITILHGAEANRASVIPDVGEPLVTTDSRKLWIGDNVTAGGRRVTAVDDVIYVPRATNMVAVDAATKLSIVQSDGTTLTLAQATQALQPSFCLVDADDPAWMGIITSGVAYLPGTSIVPGQAYWLSDTTPGELVTVEPTLSMPVCEGIAADWVRFLDWRPWSGDVAAPAPTAITLPAGTKFFRWTITEALAHGTLGYDFATLQRVLMYSEDPGPNILNSANAVLTVNSTHAGYAALTQANSVNWGSGGGPPIEIVAEFTANAPTMLYSYVFHASQGATNALYFPQGWTFEYGASLAAMTLAHTQTGQGGATGDQQKLYLIT